MVSVSVKKSLEMNEEKSSRLQESRSPAKSLRLPVTEVMNIREPMSKLRTLLENRLGVELSSFTITLQDKIKVRTTTTFYVVSVYKYE